MREVDQALARAYAQRGAVEHPIVPPAPHFAVEEHEAPPVGLVALHWPATVRTLERDYGERFDRMADALIEARDRRHLKVLLFTSCHRAEGRTTLVLTLARALARRPGRTLLVDGDLTGPMLVRQLGLRPVVGLDDVIDHGFALADALLDAPDDHLTILPLRAPVVRPRDFLTSPAWSGTLARLRREFDFVLIDGGPMFAGLNAAVPHRAIDAAVLVHNRALTGDRALNRAREVLETGGIPLLGLAETFVLICRGTPVPWPGSPPRGMSPAGVAGSALRPEDPPFRRDGQSFGIRRLAEPGCRPAPTPLRAGTRARAGAAVRTAREWQDPPGAVTGARPRRAVGAPGRPRPPRGRPARDACRSARRRPGRLRRDSGRLVATTATDPRGVGSARRAPLAGGR